jgi:hypothetical protein
MGLAGHVARKRQKVFSVWWENLKKTDPFKYLDEDGIIILK